VALSGPIDRATGQVSSSTILPGWVDIDVGSWLSERLGVRVEVDNDANLGALAESVLGAGRDATEMAYVMLSSGIGGGLILGGRLYRGARGMAGELGHVSVDDRGHMCRCGKPRMPRDDGRRRRADRAFAPLPTVTTSPWSGWWPWHGRETRAASG